MKYIEIEFADGGGMVIKAKRIPSYEEADKWLAEQVKKYGGVTYMCVISRDEAELFYDFDNEPNWKVFE